MDLHSFDHETAKTNFDTINQRAYMDGLRDCGISLTEDEVTYSHLESSSGTRYKLAKQMSQRDFEMAYMSNNCLMVVLPSHHIQKFSYDIFYRTARVTEVSFEYGEAAANSGISLQLFIRTQNHKYRAVQVEPVA